LKRTQASQQTHNGVEEKGVRILPTRKISHEAMRVRQEENDWYLSYQDPGSGQKSEQLYNAHDSVYAKQGKK
jgi:hypothetical protein